jgi:plasmid stabilization system protein ParE
VSEQPEALRLADWLCRIYSDLQTPRRAAAELRRLYAVNAELLEALRLFVDDAHTMTERERLEKARAAIDKAEGVKP